MAIEEKPLPYKQLTAVYVCRFSEPVCFTVIFPFVVFMVRDFNTFDEKDIGFYVGFIASSFAFAQFFTGMPWGMLSDRIGRRPVILLGLSGTIATSLLFGFSKSYGFALFCRLSCGLLNGNIGILRSMISELTLENTNAQRAKAYSLLPLMNGLGIIVGPMIGGLLSKPVENFPSVFGNLGPITDFLIQFPYILPCLLTSCISVFGLIYCYLYMYETLETAKSGPKAPLLKHSGRKGSKYNTFKSSSGSSSSSYSSEDEESVVASPPPKKYQALTLREALTPAVLAISLTYALTSYQTFFYEELFSIWSASPKYNFGLGFISSEIGIALAFSGGITIASQLLLVPRLVQRFGMFRLYRAALFGIIFVYFTQGFVRYLYNVPDFHGDVQTKFWVWIGLLVILTFKTIFVSITFTGSNLLTNNAAPRLDALGTVNGFSQCCGSGMQAFGPASAGMIWSASLAADWLPPFIQSHIPWTVLTGVSLITFYATTRLKAADYENPPKSVEQDDGQV